VALSKIKSGSVGVIMFLGGIVPIFLAFFIFQEIPSTLTFLGEHLFF
jgi:drug/metabolite transporter (DMT)-like permease